MITAAKDFVGEAHRSCLSFPSRDTHVHPAEGGGVQISRGSRRKWRTRSSEVLGKLICCGDAFLLFFFFNTSPGHRSTDANGSSGSSLASAVAILHHCCQDPFPSQPFTKSGMRCTGGANPNARSSTFRPLSQSVDILKDLVDLLSRLGNSLRSNVCDACKLWIYWS